MVSLFACYMVKKETTGDPLFVPLVTNAPGQKKYKKKEVTAVEMA